MLCGFFQLNTSAALGFTFMACDLAALTHSHSALILCVSSCRQMFPTKKLWINSALNKEMDKVGCYNLTGAQKKSKYTFFLHWTSSYLGYFCKIWGRPYSTVYHLCAGTASLQQVSTLLTRYGNNESLRLSGLICLLWLSQHPSYKFI